jgi:RES domain-containing protein
MASPSERTLGEPLPVFRLHDPRFAPLDATGAHKFGGRWNTPGSDVVYAALSYGGAILETRVHANVRRPPPREIAVVTLPVGLRIAELAADDLAGWDDPDQATSRAAGDAWLAAARTVALIANRGDEIRQRLGEAGADTIDVVELPYYWMATYRVIGAT